MPDSDMKKLGSSENNLYGPKGVIAYGFKVKERVQVLKVLKRSFKELPKVVFPTDIKAKSTLGDILALEDRFGRDMKSSIARTMIISGVTESELHVVMKQYKKSTLDRPLWATVTSTSIEWLLEDLIEELIRERESFPAGV